MKSIRRILIKLKAVSLSLSKAGSLQQTGFNKLTLTAFPNAAYLHGPYKISNKKHNA